MAQHETFQKQNNSHTSVQGDPRPLKYYVAPIFDTSRAKSAKLRALKAFIVVIGILVSSCLALHFLLHSYPELLQQLQVQSRWIQAQLGLKHDTDEHMDFNHCDIYNNSISAHRNVTLARRQQNKQYTFYIPIASKTYQFTSWGSIDKSMIKVVAVDSDVKYIKVDVEVTKDPRKLAKVFKLPVLKVPVVGNGQTKGVGFWARPIFNRKDWPAFSVNVQIPSTSGQQQRLNSFETRVSNFDHELKDLYNSFMFARLYTSTTNSKMKFEKVAANAMLVYNNNGAIKMDNVVATNLYLRGVNAGIKLDTVKATVGDIKTTNGEILSRMWSDKELSLATTNNRLTADCTLKKSGTIKLGTTNGKLYGLIKLQSNGAGEGTARPNYRIIASNTNQPLRLKVSEQSVGSGCWLSAWNSGAVQVQMPAAYEGKFRFNTVQNRGKVERRAQADPAGRGRQRFVVYDRPRSTASGRTGWGRADDKEQHAAGELRITSKRGPAEIIFD